MMRLTGSLLTLALLGLAAAPAGAGGPTAAHSGLEGRWLVGQRAYDPSPATAEAAALLTNLGIKVEFRDGKLRSLDPGKAKDYLLYKAEGGGSFARAVTLKAPGKDGLELHGLYKIEQGVLSLVVGTGGAQPRDFSTENNQILVVLTRAPGS